MKPKPKYTPRQACARLRDLEWYLDGNDGTKGIGDVEFAAIRCLIRSQQDRIAELEAAVALLASGARGHAYQTITCCDQIERLSKCGEVK